MNGKSYWQKRSVYNHILQVRRMERLDEEFTELFLNLTKDLNKEITYWYLQFAKDGELTSLKANERLNQKQLKEIKTDVYDFIKKAKDNIDGKYTKELNYIYNRVQLNRLECLRAVIDLKLIELYHKVDETLKKELQDAYIEAQERLQYDISKANGKLIEWSLPTEDTINTIISKPWASDGNNFSSTLWENKAKLLNALETDLRVGFVKGYSIAKITQNMANKIYSKDKKATAMYQVRRVVHTEVGYFAEESKTKALTDLGVEKYEIEATLDSNTCSICSARDREVYKYDDRIVGQTAPVFHPFCRCTTVPYFEDDFEDSKRFARDKDGNPIYVPASMTYKEYYEKYLKGGE